MNIHELDSYNLGDAVKFNDKLNSRIWGADEKMLPQVREQLLRIADDFREFLGIDVEVKDITVSGSNAAYTYTPHSDIDLHLVVDLPKADASDVYRELFDAKKYAYNDMHDIRIGGSDVELYVQDANKKHHSQGIYSIVNNDWIAVPKRRRPDVDDISVRSKFEDLGHRIEAAVKSADYEKISALTDKLKDYRQAGLDAHGEFGPENLAFKILRTQGLIKKLYDARNEAKDRLLSLDERRKKKKRKSVKYGYGAYWYPGYAYAGQDHPAGSEGGDGGGDGGGESVREDAGMTWDGVNPTTDMFTSEDASATWDGVNPTTAMFTTETEDTSDEDILRDFVNFCVKELKIEHMPRVKLRRDPQWPAMHKTFGRYNDENKTLEVSWGQRHIMDVLRTVAHELTHKHQHEREGEQMGPDAGETGSPYENEANARAGVLMRDYGRLHPEYFTVGQAHDLEESASGYIPTKAQAKDPRYSMALTVDIKPGQVGKEANKLKLKTDRQGQPQIAQANGLFENLYKEYKKFKADEDYSPNSPPGPESKPTMPAGTLRVDVSDVYDWYKLGQHISNLKGLGKHDFGAGPPSSIISFGDEDTEHKFIDQLKATDLDVTDIDPKDPKRRAGRTIKTDPTYNVDEAIQVPIGKSQDAEQYYKFILGKAKLGRPLTRDEQDYVKMYQMYRQQKLAEFAPGGGSISPPVKPPKNDGDRWEDEDDDDNKWHPRKRTEADLHNPLGDQIKTLLKKKAKIVWYPWADREQNTQYRTQAVIRQITGEQITDGRHLVRFKYSWRPWYKTAKGMELGGWRSDQTFLAPNSHQYLGLVPVGSKTYELQDMTKNPDWKDPRTPEEIEWQKRLDDLDEGLEIELDEVKMSPGALEKFATSDAAKGIRAGFEAELIFRDTQGESDEMDPEPDYDADERAYSIAQVIEFFDNDEYGYGLSDRERNRLEENLDEAYMEWRDSQMTDDFRNEAEDLVREVHLDEVPLSERIIRVLTDGMEIDDAEADKILAVGVDAPKFNTSKEQQAYAEQNPNYKIYLEALDDAEAILDEEVETSIKKQDGYYDQALDDFRDNYSGDDDSFFSDIGLRWMSDVANEYGLDWPVWNMDSRGNSGSRDWDEIGAELQQVVGMPVKVSSNYHSTPRKEGQWIIEPDGSLSPDDQSEEAGLEIVSPPMPLLMAIAKLKEVTDWANDPQGGNAYTNRSTGLHMGVSLPVRGGDVDYVKLILFMGDKYVLDTFGREANNFTASALSKLQQNIKGGKSDPAGVIKLLKHGLTELAFKELQKGVGTSKYTSAHLQNGYIEFRSPGGDWLAKADEEIGILENTMMRFARAMAIAGDPSADRQEYAKKLYKLVTADNEQYADQLRLFSEFSAGTIDKEQLKKQWAEKTIGKETGSNQRWKLYNRATGEPVAGQEYNGYTEEEARTKAKQKISPGSSDSDFDKAYELRNMSEDQQWEVYDVKTGKTLEIVKGKSKGEVADAVYDKYVDQGIGFQVRPYEDPAKLTPRAKLAKRITTKKIDYNYDIVSRNSNKVIDRFYAQTPQEADQVYGSWLKLNNLPNDTEDYGYRKSAQAADDQRDSADIQRRLGVRDVDTDVAQNFTPDYSAYERNSDRIDAIRAQAQQPRQNYELVSDEDPNRVIHSMNNATADEVRAWIAQQEAGGMPPGFLRTRIVAESWRSSIAQAIVRVEENFADGKIKGKSRPGRVKRSGASCKGSVTSLRAKAKKSGGEKGKMYHWCANMKSGRKK